jgi:hypothetical protein
MSSSLKNLAEAAGARKRINSFTHKDKDLKAQDEELGRHGEEEKIHTQPQDESMAFKCGTIAVLAAITIFTCPPTFATKEPTVLHVWYYGWLSALSTGLGAIPLM